MPQDREVLHVALGPAACHVSAHWLNLQGLSATRSSLLSSSDGAINGKNGGGDAAPLCSPAIHHFAHVLAGSGRDAVYVPRAVLVDDPTAAYCPSPVIMPQQQPANEQQQDDPLHFPTWSGAVERMDVDQQQEQQQQQQQTQSQQYHGLDERESSSKIMRTTMQQQQQPHVSDSFRQQAAQLAYGAYSRYRVPPSQQQQHQQPQQSYVSSGRHVDWDNEIEEEDEPDEDEEEWKRQLEMQRQQTWQRQQFRPAQDALEDFWNNTGAATTNIGNNTTSPKSIQDAPSPTTTTTTAIQGDNRSHSLLWRDYLMPPLHPQTCVDTPAASGFDQVVRTYHSAMQDNNNRTWFEDVLWEGVRRRLEDCDACQGLTLIETSDNGGGAFAGWGTALLREWNDECPHTGQLVLSLDGDGDRNAETPSAFSSNTSADDTPEILQNKNSSSNIAKQQRRVRQQLQRALQLCDQTELADAILPLQLPNLNFNRNKSTATSAAIVAAALESATLPFRLQNNNSTNRSMIGMQSYYAGSYSGSFPFGTAHSLSYREWLRNLQRQSANRHVLEMDALLPSNYNASGDIDLYNRLQQGTSLERDHRMRQPGYSGGIHRGRDVLPGEWMNTTTPTTTATNPSHGGLLSPLSPTVENAIPRNGDRSLHRHFALSTSLRPTTNHKTTATVGNYVECIMEGMGIRYRPEQSTATVVNQSLAQLTQDGYGAGSYWKFLFRAAPTNEKKEHPQAPSTFLPSLPILITIGNTTRVYPYLHQTAHDAQQMLSHRHVHWLQRDAAQNLLPEADDCTDAVAACWDLRDSYQPPEGSGLVVDEEGMYFDG